MRPDFQSVCRVEFRFLEEEYGFRTIRSEPDMVEYLRGEIRVVVRLDVERSRELELEFSRVGQTEPPFSLAEVLRLTAGRRPAAVHATDAGVLRRGLEQMALSARNRALPLLLDDPDRFDRLSANRVGEKTNA